MTRDELGFWLEERGVLLPDAEIDDLYGRVTAAVPPETERVERRITDAYSSAVFDLPHVDAAEVAKRIANDMMWEI